MIAESGRVRVRANIAKDSLESRLSARLHVMAFKYTFILLRPFLRNDLHPTKTKKKKKHRERERERENLADGIEKSK